MILLFHNDLTTNEIPYKCFKQNIFMKLSRLNAQTETKTKVQL